MATVIWAEPALDDLRRIHDYIARDSARYASIMIERITSATRRLEDFPDSGSRLPEIPDSPYRQVLRRPYRVIYRHDAVTDQVFVLAIVHASRDLPGTFPAAD